MHLVDRCAATNRWAGLPAGEKLVLTLLLLALTVATRSTVAHLATFIAMTALTLVGARIPPRDLVLAWTVPLGFVVLGGVSQLAVLDFGATGWSLRFDAVGLAAETLARSLAGISALLFLALSTPMGEVLLVLRRARMPAVVLDLALLMLRLVRLLVATLDDGRRAQAQRLGHDGPRRALRSAGLLGAALLPRTLARAARLERGLELRGYEGELRLRRPLWSPAPSRLASAALVLTVLVVLAWSFP